MAVWVEHGLGSTLAGRRPALCHPSRDPKPQTPNPEPRRVQYPVYNGTNVGYSNTTGVANGPIHLTYGVAGGLVHAL